MSTARKTPTTSKKNEKAGAKPPAKGLKKREAPAAEAKATKKVAKKVPKEVVKTAEKTGAKKAAADKGAKTAKTVPQRRAADLTTPTAKPKAKAKSSSRTPAKSSAKAAPPRQATRRTTPTPSNAPSTPVRIGVGGWTYEPWRDNFYPAGLPHAQELRYASRHLTAIEVNGTYYSTFKPDTFRKWRDEAPDGFVFSLKANRFATNRKLLATAHDSITRFVDSGIAELGDKLGPIVWQFMPTKAFEEEDFAAFLALLPREVGGRPLQHVMDVRHPSFLVPAYQALARRHGVSTVFTDAAKFPSFDEPEGDIVYARLMMADAQYAQGYEAAALDRWAQRARDWSAQRPTYVFFINGAKEKAPAAAGALLQRLGWTPPPQD